MGTHPNTDSYLLDLAKKLKKLFIKDAETKGSNKTIGVAFTIFINPGKSYNPLKGIHINSWDAYSDYIDYLFIMAYETSDSSTYT